MKNMKASLITGVYVEDIAKYILGDKNYAYISKGEYEFFRSNAELGAYIYHPFSLSDKREGFFCRPRPLSISGIYYARKSVSHDYKISRESYFPISLSVYKNPRFGMTLGFIDPIDVVIGKYRIQSLLDEINQVESKVKIVGKHSPDLKDELVRFQQNKREKIYDIRRRIIEHEKSHVLPIISEKPTI